MTAGRSKILITGASAGVGLSLVNLLKKDFDVIAVARRKEKMDAAWSGDSSVTSYGIDLSIAEEVDQFLISLERNHGEILYLINNAGVLSHKSTLELSRKELERAIQLNAVTPFQILKGLLPGMVKNGFGRVIQVTSGAPLNCFADYSAYSGSKAVLNAMTVTAAKEFQKLNIKINLMSPGPCRTEMAPDLPLSVEACHSTVQYLLGLRPDGPTGRFFWLEHEVPLFPDLEGVSWLEGKANGRLKKIL